MAEAYLRVKIKSLAEEAKIIRHEERRWLSSSRHIASCMSETTLQPERDTLSRRLNSHRQTLFGLTSHRRNDVRGESRASLLAYGFLRGRKYAQIEAKCYDPPPLARVAALVKKYGPGGRNEKHETLVKEWAEAGP